MRYFLQMIFMKHGSSLMRHKIDSINGIHTNCHLFSNTYQGKMHNPWVYELFNKLVV